MIPIIISLMVILISGIVYEVNAREATKNAGAATQFETVTRGNITEKVSASGTVQSTTQVKLNFSTGNGGKLSSIRVKVGDVVKAGDVLATIDDRTAQAQLASAQANLDSAIAKLNQTKQGATGEAIAVQQANAEKAQVALEGAKTAYENQLAIYNDRTQDQQQVVNVENQVKQAKIQLQSTKAGLDAAQAKLDAAREGASQEALGAARANLDAAESQYDKALLDQTGAQDALNAALVQTPQPDNINELQNAYNLAKSALTQAQVTLANAKKQLADLEAQPNSNTVAQAEAAVNQAQASVDQAEQSYNAAQDNLELAKKTYENRTQAKAQLDQVKNQLDQAKAAYNTAVAQMNQTIAPADRESIRMAQAAVDQARVQVQQQEIALNNLTLKAPINGVVAQINGNVGEMPSASQPVVAMNDSNANMLQVMAQVSQNDVIKLKSGQSAEITTTAVRDKGFKGTALVVYPEASTQNGVTNYNVLLSVENPGGLLKPGMTANVSINVGTHKNVLYVPIQALKEFNGTDGVYLAPADSQKTKDDLRFQPVTIGLFGSDKVEITSGLQAGDRVAVSFPNNETEKKSSSGFGGFGSRSGGGSR